MAYQALYRVYRPKTFEQMVGQEVITKTLENAIEAKQTGHAYLFSGPRGTGKTSAAKIFAREVNGIGPDQANQSHPDIIEIDAASNNGVDEIRSIRDSANYAPIEAPFKIYIIDEAHMLSTGAFNALLKTLEEPPAQVKFILATTEVQKMPATILSRTQRFEFKRLSNQTIKNRMIEILNQEKQDFEDTALDVVATAAEGGMRDALSILDQVIAFGPDKITLENALTVTGSVKIDQLLTYLNQVLAHDTAQALETLSAILLAGKDANRFLADLMATLRDVMLVDLAPDLVKSTSKIDELKEFKQRVGQDQIQQMLVVIDDVKTQLAQSLQSDIYLEILTVKLSLVDGAHASQPVQVPAAQAKTAAAAQKPGAAQPESKKTESVVQAPTATAKAEVPQGVDHGPAMDDLAGLVEPDTEPAPIAEPAVPVTQQAEPYLSETAKPKPQAEQPAVPTPAESVQELPTVYTGKEAVQAVLSQAKRDSLTQAQTSWSDLVKDFAVKDQAVLQTVEPMAASADAMILAFDFPAILDTTLTNTTLLSKLAAALGQLHLPETLILRTKDEWQNDRADYVTALKSGQKINITLADLTPTMLADNRTQQPSTTAKDMASQPTDQVDLVQEAKDLFGDDLVQVTETKDED